MEDPSKCIDGLLRPNEYPEKGHKVLLGDVASTLIKISGPHDSIHFSNPPLLMNKGGAWYLFLQN